MNASQPLTLERFEKFESTMTDFMSAVNNRFDLIDNKFQGVDSQFDKIDARFDRNEEVIQSLVVSQDLLLGEMRDVKRRVVGLEHSMDDVQYSISALSRAEEKDAEATMNHEIRLPRLEKLNKIKAISPAHLMGASE